jgi:hypothetical protein
MRLTHCKFKLFLSFWVIGCQIHAIAQETQRYAIYFHDKPETSFDPFAYFSEKAIERRMMQRLPLFDWYDLPVNEQ